MYWCRVCYCQFILSRSSSYYYHYYSSYQTCKIVFIRRYFFTKKHFSDHNTTKAPGHNTSKIGPNREPRWRPSGTQQIFHKQTAIWIHLLPEASRVWASSSMSKGAGIYIFLSIDIFLLAIQSDNSLIFNSFLGDTSLTYTALEVWRASWCRYVFPPSGTGVCAHMLTHWIKWIRTKYFIAMLKDKWD